MDRRSPSPPSPPLGALSPTVSSISRRHSSLLHCQTRICQAASRRPDIQRRDFSPSSIIIIIIVIIIITGISITGISIGPKSGVA
ncbi:hypothetical protein CSUB01_06242 [Colletotrichum sublineola]|uniref:Uncharacterized protein n=1 Tax=Colletotrichum sublineola TaxID=1173701 RepID=A0A066XF24_COLSU|nr:hypothetical protein CSUB01_06242 [Colletotrichum sublineola]